MTLTDASHGCSKGGGWHPREGATTAPQPQALRESCWRLAGGLGPGHAPIACQDGFILVTSPKTCLWHNLGAESVLAGEPTGEAGEKQQPCLNSPLTTAQAFLGEYCPSVCRPHKGGAVWGSSW